MADNISITPGSGATVRTNQQSSDNSHIQVIQPSFGADGASALSLVDAPAGLPTQFHRPTTQLLTWAPVAASSSGDTTLIAGTTAKTQRIMAMFFSFASAVNVKFGDSTVAYFNTTAMAFPAGVGVLDFCGEPWFVTASGKGFAINLSAAVAFAGWVGYTLS